MRQFAAIAVASALAACGPSKHAGADAAIDLAADVSDFGAIDDAGTARRESLVWIWTQYPQSLAAVAQHHASFTHASPALYQLNYAYTSGVPAFNGANNADSFDGLTSLQVSQKIHAAGLACVPLIKAGASNGGVDSGVQAILDDAPAGARQSFIDSLVSEAIAKGYDGWNLDWEVNELQTTYAAYGAKLESLLAALGTALHASGRTLSIDVAGFLVKESNCSGGRGFFSLAKAGPLVDRVIWMDYYSVLGGPSSACPSSVTIPQACKHDFTSALDLMCGTLPPSAISVGLESLSTSSNPIAGAAIAETEQYGLRAVAIWPASNTDGPNLTYEFLDNTGMVPASNWYTLLAAFVATP